MLFGGAASILSEIGTGVGWRFDGKGGERGERGLRASRRGTGSVT